MARAWCRYRNVFARTWLLLRLSMFLFPISWDISYVKTKVRCQCLELDFISRESFGFDFSSLPPASSKISALFPLNVSLSSDILLNGLIMSF